MNRKAFTMLELIFVIVVIGILAAVFIPRISNNDLSRATNQVINDIRYAQHLALMDDQYNARSATWYNKRWSINLCQASYKVTSLDNTKTALSPQKKEQIDGSVTKDYNLSKKYGVTVSAPTTQCIITFDHLGRPFGFSSGSTASSPVSNLLHSSVDINLTKDNITKKIRIEPETGYVHLLWEELKYVYELKRINDATIKELKYKNLPERITIAYVEMVENPF